MVLTLMSTPSVRKAQTAHLRGTFSRKQQAAYSLPSSNTTTNPDPQIQRIFSWRSYPGSWCGATSLQDKRSMLESFIYCITGYKPESRWFKTQVQAVQYTQWHVHTAYWNMYFEESCVPFRPSGTCTNKSSSPGGESSSKSSIRWYSW